MESRTLLSLLGNRLFPADNPWNQRITDAPAAVNSTAVINNIVSLNGSNGRLHPDFGQDTRDGNPLYGIPYNVVHGNSQPKVHVVIDAYAGESDLQDAPVPAGAVLEGDQQNGPTVGVDARGDSHLIVYDVDNNVAYEFYRASRPSENTDGRWHADQESVWDMKTITFGTLGWTSADAAGLAILPGLVRPDEALPVSQGGQGVINHAIRFTLQNNVILNQFLYPASHTANSGNNNAAVQPPMGARFRLKAGVDISTLNPQSKVIAQAMKDYGMIVADNGSDFFFSGASDSVDASNGLALTWNDNDIQDSSHGLKSLHFSDFEVVDLSPRVTGLSGASGAVGTTITVVGQNFSGAAGHLQVLFGSIAATNVVVVDDAHLTATVPAGSGTVDVRVQSGVTTASNSRNVTNPVFGYGTSATSTADRFTYQAQPGNSPPKAVADSAITAARAAVTVHVLANDSDPDGDPLHVSAVTKPAHGKAVINADSTVTYTPSVGYSGTDHFVYTVADGRGGTATATVTITVQPPNRAPNARADARTTFRNTAVRIAVLANDSDPDGDHLTLMSATSAAHGKVVINSDGTVSYTPAKSFLGTDSFSYTVGDGRGGKATAKVMLTVKKK
jgi:hypothetical protein